MGKLPDYKKVPEERLNYELNLYGLYFGLKLYAEEYDDGYYFKDCETDIIVGKYVCFSKVGFGNFYRSEEALQNIKAMKTGVKKVAKEYESKLANERMNKIKLAGVTLVIGLAVSVSSLFIGRYIGIKGTEDIYKPQVEVNYSGGPLYSIENAPVDLVALWAINEFQEYQQRVCDGGQEALLARVESITESQYHPFLSNYYKYVDMRASVEGKKINSDYIGCTAETLEEYGNEIKCLAANLVECFDMNDKFWNSPYAYVKILPEDYANSTSCDDLVYYVRVDVANKYFLDKDVNLNEGIPDGVIIENGLVYISNHSIQDLNEEFKLSK